MTIHITPVWKTCINEGNAALAEGRGFDAQAHFASAEGQGLPPAFAAVHSAMALLLLGRHSAARTTVEAALPHAAGVFVHAQSRCSVNPVTTPAGSAQPGKHVRRVIATLCGDDDIALLTWMSNASFKVFSFLACAGALPPEFEVEKKTGSIKSKSFSAIIRSISTEPTMPRQPKRPTVLPEVFIVFALFKK